MTTAEHDLQRENATLRQRVAELEQLFTLSPDLICVAGFDGYFKRLNPAWSRTLGWTDAELYARPFLDFVHPDDRQATIDAAQSLSAQQPIIAFTNRYACKDGSYRWIEWMSMPVAEQQHIYAVARDITVRKQEEEELLMRQFALDHGSDMVEWMDETGRIVYVNDTVCQCLGYTRAELLQMTLTDIDPHFPPDQWASMWAYLQQHRTITLESVHQRKDGSIFPVEVSGSYLEIHGKAFAMGFVRDITERKQQQDELHLFKVLVENAPDAISISSPEDGTYQFINPAFRTLFGYGDEIIGRPITDIYTHDNLDRFPKLLTRLHETGKLQGTMTFQRKDGSTVPCYYAIFTLMNAAGQPLAYVGFIHDITEQKQAESDRLALQQQIIDAQQAAIQQLSAPLLPLAKEVVALPLIGSIDSRRTQQIMQVLLEGIERYQATTAIVDITGVQVVDTQVAQALILTARAVKLLGARVILTGIQPQIAQTLVHLGIDLSDIITRSTLQAGIAYAIESAPNYYGSS